jgi:hypothetical protein
LLYEDVLEMRDEEFKRYPRGSAEEFVYHVVSAGEEGQRKVLAGPELWY